MKNNHVFKVYTTHKHKASECTFNFSYPIDRVTARRIVLKEGWKITR